MSAIAAIALSFAVRLGLARLTVLILALLLVFCGQCAAQSATDSDFELALATPAREPAQRLLAGRRPAAAPVAPAGELIACLPDAAGRSRILFDLPVDSGLVRLRIEDDGGTELALLHDGALPAGEHAARFDYHDLVGDTCWVVLESGGQRRTMKLRLME